MTKETDGPSFLDHDGAKEEPLDLLAKLRRLAGDDAQRYVDLLFPTSDPDASEAQKKHNARTAAYKRSKALRLAPDSEAIAQACSFAVLSIVSRTDDFARALASMVVKELTDAGYDRHETHAVIGRLTNGLPDRKRGWQTRTRQRLARQLATAIREERNR